MSHFLCTSEEKELKRAQKIHSRVIDDEIRRARLENKGTRKLLLLGLAQSGKTTIAKQFKLLYANGFTEQEKQQITLGIKSNIREIIMTIIKAMPLLNLPITLELPENEARMKYILEEASKPDYDFPQEFYDHCMKLWEDKGVMECYGRSNEYQLLDCAPYFMNPMKLRAIANPNFTPTNADILHCWVETKKIDELKFVMEQYKFHIVDASAQQATNRKWLQVFSGITAILFVVACDSYNLSVPGDPTKNHLLEALELFESIWNNRWLKTVSVILLLTKQDLLKVKVLDYHFKIETYFPEYATYQLVDDISSTFESGENPEIRRAKGFIKDLFVNVVKGSPDNRHSLYCHFTCGINDGMDITRKVWNDSSDIKQRNHLRRYELQ